MAAPFSPRQRHGLVVVGLLVLGLGLVQGLGLGWRRYAPLPTPLARPVTVVELSAPDLASRVRREQRRQLTRQDRCVRAGLQTLGLVASVEPPAPDVAADAHAPWWSRWADRVEAGGADGLYVPGSDTVFVRTDASATVLHHERLHAWEDQHATATSRMRRLASGRGSFDERVALRAVIEATAHVLSGGRPVGRVPGADLDANAWLLAYRLTPAAVEHLRGDPAALVGLTPRSTAEMLFPSQPAPPAWEPSNEGSASCGDRIGPLGLLTLAMQTDAIGAERRGWELARGWIDDRMQYAVGSGQATWEICVRPSVLEATRAVLRETAQRRRSTSQIVVQTASPPGTAAGGCTWGSPPADG